MAYAQWVEIVLKNVSANGTLVVQNAGLSWGKFYQEGNKDAEIDAKAISGHKIAPGEQFTICSCGRSDASSGTEGTFDVQDEHGVRVRTFHWDCPWGSKRNTWTVSNKNDKYIVDSEGGNLDSGALGRITVEIAKKGA